MGSEALFAAVNTSFPPGKNDRGEAISGIVLKMVAIAMVNRMNGSGECFSSYSTIANDAGGIDRGAAMQAAKWLEGLGLFSKERGTKRASNSWRLKREAVREEGGRWHFSGWGFMAPTSGVTPPVEPPNQSSHPTGCVTQPGGCVTQPALVVSPNLNDPLNDPGKDLIERGKETPDASPDSIPETETPAPETKTEPVEPVFAPPVPESKVPVREAGQDPANPARAAAPPATGPRSEHPRMVPVAYLSPRSVVPRHPVVEKLVEMFLNYQMNPGLNEPHTLLAWHESFSRLLKQYGEELPAYMEYAFTKDRFWKDGKLIRKRNSRSKEGKVYADPLDYFEEKLEGIVSTYSRIRRAQEVAKEKSGRRAQREGASEAPPCSGHEDGTLLSLREVLNMATALGERAEAIEYVRKHEDRIRQEQPDAYAEYKTRGYYDR